DADAGAAREERRERVEMRIVSVGRQDHELEDALSLPIGEQLVERAVERLLPERCGPRERSVARDVDAVVEGRRAQYVVFPREVHGDAAGDQDVRAEREVGA